MSKDPRPTAGRRSRLPVRPVRAAAVLASVLLLPLLQAPAAQADEWRDRQYWLADYGITDAWKTSRGEGVRVAVIDTGIDSSHPDLTGAVTAGTDVSGAGAPDGSSSLGPNREHGTLVATLLAGRGHVGEDSEKPKDGQPNPDGVIGVAPAAELLSVSAWIGGSNPGGIPIEEQIPQAVRWAVDSGAKVINMSLGSTSTAWPESWDDAFLYAEQNDVVIVAAAGNRGGGIAQVGAPATIPGVLTVAGLDRGGEASVDSSAQGISIAVAAPAEELIGGLPEGASRYARWSGSSAAAPIVAGVAALIRSAYPELSAADVINRIITTAEDRGDPGLDPIYGYGVLDAAAAVGPGLPGAAVNPLGTIEEWIRIHRRGSSPDDAAVPPPVGEPAPDIPSAAAPEPKTSGLESDALPAVLVLGFGALTAGVAAAGAIRIRRVRRGGGEAVETVPGAGSDGGGS